MECLLCGAFLGAVWALSSFRGCASLCGSGAGSRVCLRPWPRYFLRFLRGMIYFLLTACIGTERCKKFAPAPAPNRTGRPGERASSRARACGIRTRLPSAKRLLAQCVSTTLRGHILQHSSCKCNMWPCFYAVFWHLSALSSAPIARTRSKAATAAMRVH